MNWLRSCLLMVLVVPAHITYAQPKQMVNVNVEQWPSPNDTTVYWVYEQHFDEFVEGQDSLNLVYLKQSLWWRPDSTWAWTEFVFDSVIGRGDQRQVLITVVTPWTVLPDNAWLDSSMQVTYGGMYALAPNPTPTLPGTPPDTLQYPGYRKYSNRADSAVGLGSWLGYTTRIYPKMWFPIFSRGNWRTLEYSLWSSGEVIELTYSLEKVVGLAELSRALLRFHASRKPLYELRWWKR